MKTCRPRLLPVLDLKWRFLVNRTCEAREAVARFDEDLKREKNALHILEPLFWQESMSQIRSRKFKVDFLHVLRFRETRLSKKELASAIQKIIDAQYALKTAMRWKPKKRIGLSFYCRTHALMNQNESKKNDIGRIRNRQNWIGAEGCGIEDAYFYPPAPSRIRPLLRNLDAFLSANEIEPLVSIAIGFAQFLIIHPFMDGNGRIARLLIPVLAKKKKLLVQPALLMSEYFETRRYDYFQKLFRISEKNQWEEWIAFFLDGVIWQTHRSRKRFCRLQKLWKEIASASDETTARTLFDRPLILKEKIQQKRIKEKFLIAQDPGFDLFEPLVRTMRIR